jgi:4-aminobutyrate aminotransferase-like enzyme
MATEILDRDNTYVIHGANYAPIIMVEGKGCILKDMNGKEYLDCLSGCAGPMFVGYGRPEIAEAINKHASFPHTFFGHVNAPRAELAEKLAKIAPHGLTKSWFGTGGGEAVETALKGAMKFTGKRGVISLYNGYHGMTIALSNLGQWRLRRNLPTVPGFKQIPSAYCYRCYFGKTYPECDFECARFLEYVIEQGSSNDIAAFLLEPIQGMGGHIFPPSEEYSKIIAETCNKFDVLVVADEIQTGFGRTGKMWGSETIGLQPDIMCVGKGLGGGLPISATVFREDIASHVFKDKDPNEWWHSLTFGGNPMGCATGSVVIDIIVTEKAPDKAAKMGEYWTERLEKMKREHDLIGDVRARGLYIGVELVKNKKTKLKATEEAFSAVKTCLARGIWFALSQQPGIGNVIKIKPSFVITEHQSAKALDVLGAVVEELERKA